MARLTGKSEKTIRRYLDPADHTEPSLTFMHTVCTEYGVNMDQLVLSGGVLADTDTDEKWNRVISWWTANLSTGQKELLLGLFSTVWESALDAGDNNPNLRKEVSRKIPRT